MEWEKVSLNRDVLSVIDLYSGAHEQWLRIESQHPPLLTAHPRRSVPPHHSHWVLLCTLDLCNVWILLIWMIRVTQIIQISKVENGSCELCNDCMTYMMCVCRYLPVCDLIDINSVVMLLKSSGLDILRYLTFLRMRVVLKWIVICLIWWCLE